MGNKEIEYYPHMDYDERTPPTQREARLMCKTAGRTCPVADQCLKTGLSIQAPVGVWGGQVLVDGERYYPGRIKNNGS